MQVMRLAAVGGSKRTLDFGGTLLALTVRYNYTGQFWSLDLADAQGVSLLAGLTLVPGVDLLKPYPQLKRTLGALILVEQFLGDYQSPGLEQWLLWFAPGEALVFP